MAQKLDENEMVSFKELLMANSIQVDALAQLLIEEGIITQVSFLNGSNITREKEIICLFIVTFESTDNPLYYDMISIYQLLLRC